MTAIKSTHKTPGSRLVQVFGGRLKDWANELQEYPGTIVAISRKGPRLIELMEREGFLSGSVLSRVIAEQALPFLTQNNNAGFAVVDDAMTYGTTFARIFRLTEQANIRCGGGLKLTGIPFAVGQEASSKYRELVTKHFLDLKPDQIAPFVNNEMLAFRLLGKPYDIEHPMLTWIGDFTDTFKLEATLEQITELLGGQKVNIDTSVPTSSGNVSVRRWTILLPADSRYNLHLHSDFRKLRIYLNPEKDRLLVAAICPLSLSKANIDSFGEILPAPLDLLWKEAAGQINTKADKLMAITGDRSLVMWANFLLAVVLLHNVKAAFLEAFEAIMSQPQMLGPRREDLQYLIGPNLCSHAESSLAHFLECVDVNTPALHQLFDHASEIMGEKIPVRYEKDYTHKLPHLIDKALDVNDVLQAVFYTQHTDIALISRKDNKDKDNIDDINRLEFGITYGKLRQIVQARFPATTEIDIHESLDSLIDNGAIVPRYLDMAPHGKSSIWARTFRVGEGTVQEAAHTVILLFEKLSEALGKIELPPIVFEKFCVLALNVATDIDALKPLRSDKISKEFHLYGARSALLLGKKPEFLTEWAVSKNILSRNSKGAGFSEQNGYYTLRQDTNTLYPRGECHLDDKVKNCLEDLAGLVAAIYEKHKSSMLVALTSTASKKELQYALEAELRLWLYDYAASVYKGLAELSRLADKITPDLPANEKEQLLESVNTVLSNTANFTAQVKIKIKLEENIKGIYEQIDKLFEEKISGVNKYIGRVWRELRITLDGRIGAESDASSLQEITSALRIAHVATRVLRELLILAGFKDERSTGLKESLDLLQATLDNSNNVDPVTKTMFANVDSKQSISTLITITKSQPLDNFKEAFPDVRKLILEIADRCEQVLLTHGTKPPYEKPVQLVLPHYIMMWDVKDSTKEKSRDEIESLIVNANQKIKETLGNQIKSFHADSKNDGNSLICEKFSDVLTVFQILNKTFPHKHFRAGCEVNLLGEINYYPKSNTSGGRAYEYAARITDFYKEIEIYPALWSGTSLPSEPTEASYMVVSEFARRYAEQEGSWQVNEAYIVNDLAGTYGARVNASLPISMTILQPIAFKPKSFEDSESSLNQRELI